MICVGNKGCAASLELRKIYQVIPDKGASKLHQLSVMDESGEDYLYPLDYFVPVQLPQAVERAELLPSLQDSVIFLGLNAALKRRSSTSPQAARILSR